MSRRESCAGATFIVCGSAELHRGDNLLGGRVYAVDHCAVGEPFFAVPDPGVDLVGGEPEGVKDFGGGGYGSGYGYGYGSGYGKEASGGGCCPWQQWGREEPVHWLPQVEREEEV